MCFPTVVFLTSNKGFHANWEALTYRKLSPLDWKMFQSSFVVFIFDKKNKFPKTNKSKT